MTRTHLGTQRNVCVSLMRADPVKNDARESDSIVPINMPGSQQRGLGHEGPLDALQKPLIGAYLHHGTRFQQLAGKRQTASTVSRGNGADESEASAGAGDSDQGSSLRFRIDLLPTSMALQVSSIAPHKIDCTIAICVTPLSSVSFKHCCCAWQHAASPDGAVLASAATLLISQPQRPPLSLLIPSFLSRQQRVQRGVLV